MKNKKFSLIAPQLYRRQQGVTLIIALVALVLLLISAIALVRSFGASNQFSTLR